MGIVLGTAHHHDGSDGARLCDGGGVVEQNSEAIVTHGYLHPMALSTPVLSPTNAFPTPMLSPWLSRGSPHDKVLHAQPLFPLKALRPKALRAPACRVSVAWSR